MKARAESLLGRLALAARPGRPWVRVTAPPWLARVLVAAGAQKGLDSMTIDFSAVTSPSLMQARTSKSSNATWHSEVAADVPTEIVANTSVVPLIVALKVEVHKKVRYLTHTLNRSSPSLDQLNFVRELVGHFAQDLNNARRRVLIRARILATKIVDIDDALAHQAPNARDLALFREPLVRDLALARAFAHNLTLARDIAYDVARELHSFAVRDIIRPDRLADEFTKASELIYSMEIILGESIDASDVDLSALAISDLDAIAGLLWSRGTIWPAELVAQVTGRSRQIRPGIFQIVGGNMRNDTNLVRS